MDNYRAKGEVFDYINSTIAAISSGDVVFMGGQGGIASTDIAINATGSVAVIGVFELTKKTGQAWTQGQRLYYDIAEAAVQSDDEAGANAFIGVAYAAAAADAVIGYVKLGQPGALAVSARGSLAVSLKSLTLEDGTAIGKFADADSATPGFNQVGGKELVVRWNNHATPTAVALSLPIPLDLDASQDVEVHWLAAMSGATDSPDLLHECYFGAGDDDCAGVDDEIAGGVALTEYTSTIAAADVAAAPSVLTLIFGPKAGELATDDLLVYGCWIEYTALTANA